MQLHTQFDCTRIYCSVTGKPIGEYLDSEWNNIRETTNDDFEDIAFRNLASMRPSMLWNRMNVETLESIRQVRPDEVMAYLLNRLFEPLKDDKGYPWAQLHLNRIKIYAKLESLERTEDFDSVLLMLLEIEGKLGLRTERAPFKCEALLESEHFMANLRFLLTPWYNNRIAYHLEQEREAKFFAANPGARKAWARQFFETAPKSETTIKKEAKQKESNFFDAMLDELMGTADSKPSVMRPNPDHVTTVSQVKAVLPSTKMPMRWGVKAVEA